jgi:hypothetical protein
MWAHIRESWGWAGVVVGTLVLTFVLYRILPILLESQRSTALTDAIYLTTAIIIALYTLETHRMCLVMLQQMLLAHEPTVRVLPEHDIQGEVASLTLSLLNAGLGEIVNIDIFVDGFVAVKPLTPVEGRLIAGQLEIMAFGGSTVPHAMIPRLRPKEQVDFPVEFRRVYQQMSQAYVESTGARMRILRLYITYRRAPDGRLFTTTKFYGVGGDGSDLDEWRGGMDQAFPSHVSWKEVTRALQIDA